MPVNCTNLIRTRRISPRKKSKDRAQGVVEIRATRFLQKLTFGRVLTTANFCLLQTSPPIGAQRTLFLLIAMSKQIFEEDDLTSSEELQSWVATYCQLFGHEFFAQIPAEYIEDDFNLTGLAAIVPYYREALDMILDYDFDSEEETKPADKQSQLPLIEHSAELLYGLIHQRFILTKQGLGLMAAKFESGQFGKCPRVLCEQMPLLPMGRHDQPGKETVRLYCACCNDIYLPSSSKYLNIDGSFFGTSFPGMFLKVFPEVARMINNRTQNGQFELKCFGFKVNEVSASGSRMRWLRMRPQTEAEIAEYEQCEFGAPSEVDGSSKETMVSDDQSMS
ncbi:hypothetical protein BABINDRAFT_169009 [Babjeviella inositovora NRRL Y-12698]|uniref:Casein kinase II subunit beta n=1 Tax=Babjeviella inositovora NRRL Y-12698 TaxID=984486 RepID=A0A1E3QJ27_9ASCO|nr:uncharacterized protein BABINDRAFT_169009 [Babjeviella inositovora NRRL Y-12698]ODQ77701.1 hypothetical protein BABINDRAFT_169009 [Babjeviella inositovora NRRL Y-12698]